MNFQELEAYVPYVKGEKLHDTTTKIAKGEDWAVVAKAPGKYQDKTNGGDFVVVVNDKRAGWKWHRFSHIDLFKDIEQKLEHTTFMQESFAPAYAAVIHGEADPLMQRFFMQPEFKGLHLESLLVASQALALAEHRRYKQFEKNGGGRYLPARFALGIIFGKWSALDAANWQFKGAPGIQYLEKTFGTPPTLASFNI